MKFYLVQERSFQRESKVGRAISLGEGLHRWKMTTPMLFHLHMVIHVPRLGEEPLDGEAGAEQDSFLHSKCENKGEDESIEERERATIPQMPTRCRRIAWLCRILQPRTRRE